MLQPNNMRTKASMVATRGVFTKKMIIKGASKLAAMDSCFGLTRPRQHGIANKMAHGFPHEKM